MFCFEFRICINFELTFLYWNNYLDRFTFVDDSNVSKEKKFPPSNTLKAQVHNNVCCRKDTSLIEPSKSWRLFQGLLAGHGKNHSRRYRRRIIVQLFRQKVWLLAVPCCHGKDYQGEDARGHEFGLSRCGHSRLPFEFEICFAWGKEISEYWRRGAVTS